VSNDDYLSVKQQLKQIVSEGHFIYPHLHGHWHDAVFDTETKTWRLENLKYYRFEALPKSLQSFYFEESMHFLNSIVENKFDVDAYRAGGWSIQPFELFKPYFLKHGIKKEFSVIPGKLTKSNAHCFDFTPAKINKPYHFENEVCDEDLNGQFTEYPISTITFSTLERWIDFKMSGIQKKIFSNKLQGSTVNTQIVLENDVISPINKRIPASFEGMNILRLTKLVYLTRTKNYFQTISHPKLLRKIDFFYMKIYFRLTSK
jgi:hypothetical protein